MKKIVVASLNPIKSAAVMSGFQCMFPEEDFEIAAIDVDSGVEDQPLSDRIAQLGAQNRAQSAKQALPVGDYWVGLEGGCDYLDEEMIAFAWIVVLADGLEGSSRTAHFRLPGEVKRLVESGIELGEADDRVFGRENSKQKSGAVGLLSGDVITRKTLYEQAVILALIPFRNSELY